MTEANVACAFIFQETEVKTGALIYSSAIPILTVLKLNSLSVRPLLALVLSRGPRDHHPGLPAHEGDPQPLLSLVLRQTHPRV